MFRAPMASDVTEMAPHAIPHDGTAVTYDMASLTRRRQKYRTTKKYRLRLRRGIRADAEIRRRLSGEKYIRRQIGRMLSHLPRGIREASPRTRRVSKTGEGTRHTFYGYRFPSRLHDAWQRGRKLPKYSRDTPLRISEVSSSRTMESRRKT